MFRWTSWVYFFQISLFLSEFGQWWFSKLGNTVSHMFRGWICGLNSVIIFTPKWKITGEEVQILRYIFFSAVYIMRENIILFTIFFTPRFTARIVIFYDAVFSPVSSKTRSLKIVTEALDRWIFTFRILSIPNYKDWMIPVVSGKAEFGTQKMKKLIKTTF